MAGRAELPRLRPTVRGAAMLVAGALLVGLAARPGLGALAYPGVLAIALVLVAAGVAFARGRIRQRSRTIAPDPVTAGEPLLVTVRLEAGRLAAGTRWWDELSPGLLGDASGLLAPDEDGVLAARSRLIAVRRGRHETGPLSIEAVDPFGLVRVRRRLAGALPVVALPAVVDLGAAPLTADGGAAASSDARRGSVRGLEDQIPREWRSGDGIRRIHWRATAHRGELMVRQEEPAEDAGVAIVLDAAPEGFAAGPAGAVELDRAVELAASVLAAAGQLDARTTLAVLGDGAPPMLVGSARATHTLEEALVRLALLQPGEQAPPSALAAPVVVAVLGRVDAARAAAIAAARRPGARGIAIVIGPGDAPAVEALEAAGWDVAAWSVGVRSTAADVVAVWAAATGARR